MVQLVQQLVLLLYSLFILNKYNFTVGKDKPTKQCAGDELTIIEFQSLNKSKFDTYSPEIILNLDETQLSRTLASASN